MFKIFQKYWPHAAIILLVFIFFYKLFIPLSVFITPDYGRSDLLNFNIPIHTFAADFLKHGRLPIWVPTLGQGFPLLDEGQIGFFYIPNIILFALLPFTIAFNLSYPATFLIAAFGTYFLARSFGVGKTGSFLSAVTFTFSPIFVLQISHLNLIQAASITPWLFWLANSFFENKKKVYLTLLPIFISQQILTGFTQLSLYALTGLLIFVAYKIYFQKTSPIQKTKIAFFFLSGLIFAIIISLSQILPSLTLSAESGRIDQVNPQKILLDFPYKPKNILTIFSPYILGDISKGTYPQWHAGVWGIFWESNTYFGIVQLIIVTGFVISLVIKSFKSPNKLNIIFWISLGLLALILSLGPYAPLHPLFSVPPYSIFRVPSRFLMLFFLSAAILAGFAIDRFAKHRSLRILIIIILLLASGDIFRVWTNYNPIGKADKWLAPPELSKSIDSKSRVASLGENGYWNSIFLKYGWQGKDEDFYFFRNFLSQNPNANFNFSSLFVYAGMTPKRIQYIETLTFFDTKPQDGKLIIGPISQKVLNSTNTGFLITPYPIDSDIWTKTAEVAKDKTTIYLYKNSKVLPHIFAVSDYHVSTTIQDVAKTLASADFDPAKTAILEKDIDFKKTEDLPQGTVEITKYEPTKIEAQTNLHKNAIVVLSDSFYPNWQAKIDGKKTEILAANLNSRAVVVPEGNHIITFSYVPKAFYLGLAITIIGYLGIITLLARKLIYRLLKTFFLK